MTEFKSLLKMICAVFLIVLTLVACNITTTLEDRQIISDEFPDAEITNVPRKSTEYLVREMNGEVWYVYMTTMDGNAPNAIKKVRIFRARKTL